MTPKHANEENLGQFGWITLDSAAGEQTGPFLAIQPVGSSGIQLTRIECDNVAAGDETKLEAVTGVTQLIRGRITLAHVGSGTALAYKAQDYTG